jgi:hypothetical protein
MKDLQQKTDSPQPDVSPAIARPGRRRQHEDSHGGSQSTDRFPDSHSEGAALSAPELSHPANAAPLADLLTQLQQSHGNAHVQQVVAEMSEAKTDALSEGHTSGQTLDAGVRSEMESAFGENFGEVRIHTDREAEKETEALGARAFTRGRDIYFGGGEYNAATREGKELLAHELTHVVQQGGDAAQRERSTVNHPGDQFEAEADRAAHAVLSGEPVPIVNRSAAPAVQRQTRPGAVPHIPGAIDLRQSPHGGLSGGVTYAYDAAAHQLTLDGPTQMSVSAVQGGQIVFDSARATMTQQRTRTITIRITGTHVSFSVNNTTFRMIP